MSEMTEIDVQMDKSKVMGNCGMLMAIVSLGSIRYIPRLTDDDVGLFAFLALVGLFLMTIGWMTWAYLWSCRKIEAMTGKSK